MGKSTKQFMKNLQSVLDSGTIKKIDLHRTTGIARNSIDGYLSGSVPDLDALDKIADALNCDPWDLIKPQDAPIFRNHTLTDCMDAIAHAVGQAAGYTPTQVDHAIRKKAAEQKKKT